jgi:sterol desaturase/sphingolipid hydroxylase (fatty acid hydroxylase superfamily)
MNILNQKGDIESYTSHFVAAQGISRILYITFWIFTYAELNTESAMSLLSEYVGYWFMASQIIHLIIMADFMYYWVKAVRHGSGVIQLPTYI